MASSRLCVVPPLTKTGDSVIIPLSSQTPFLVDERPDQMILAMNLRVRLMWKASCMGEW
ncbi:hypothetical protein F5Y07DRAFT_349971 [Xylaria sp. FL0933]|nr:hypothetical protein F5Y07DRAFT_349971 [Xylaria sp. FL0933]